MALSTTSRLGLQKWGAGTDGPTRAQFNSTHQAIDDLAAIARQGNIASRPSAGVARTFYWGNDDKSLSLDDGTAWNYLPTYARAGTWLAAQNVVSDTAGQVTIDSATTTTGVTAQLMVRRRNASDLTTYKRLVLESTNLLARLTANSESTVGGGNGSDITGIDGRWSINWNSTSVAPDQTLIIKARAGNELARFTEGGFVGLGHNNPTHVLDVKSAASVPVARFGGIGQDYALTITPKGVNRAVLGFGMELSGSTYTAQASLAGFLDVTGNVLSWYGDSGLTAGVGYAPSLRFQITDTGRTTSYSSRFGIGAMVSSGSFLDVASTDASTVSLTTGGDLSNGFIRLVPHGSLGKLFIDIAGTYRAASFGRTGGQGPYAGFGGWVALGNDGSPTDANNPGIKLQRFTDILDSAGHCASLHNAVVDKKGRVLHCSAFTRGDSGEEVPLVIESIDEGRVRAHAPGTSSDYAGRLVVGSIIFTSLDTASW